MAESGVDILLIEDNSNDVELITRVFRKHNLANTMVVLKNGVEALEFLSGQGGHIDRIAPTPKVILLDLKLPKVDGIEVLRRIKSDERTRNIPVVILTSSTEQRDLKAAYELGANSYVTKPIKFAEFSKVVAELGMYWLILNKSPYR
ncbi:MAG: response regulator [Desulfobacteraceae bacterium]|nr:MAG: response regulator [Desulfobacteraceae bacterium]